MTNADVAAAFLAQRPAHTANLRTDGVSIQSYGWWEFARWVNGDIVKRVGRSYSITTAGKHRNQVWAGADASTSTPVDQGRMNL
jgi:hypothetical protein